MERLELSKVLESIARGKRSRDILLKMSKVLGRKMRNVKKVGSTSIFVEIDRDTLPKVALLVLYNEPDVYFRTMVASDERRVEGVYKLYYVFGIDSEGTNIVLEVALPQDEPVAPTIVDIVKAIDWYEMEAHDLMGIVFRDRDLPRFVLPDDWPQDLYPLRKDVSIDSIRKNYSPKAIEHARAIEAEQIVKIPIGPYHPALHEPEYFELYVRGEKVIDSRYVGFLVHRGIEKLAENMKYNQVPFLAERICGICGFVHSTSYCQAVEDALSIDVPERAHFIRSIVLEIERIHSHLLWIGVALHLLGYDTGFMHIWRVREKIMIIAELLTGSRKTYGINIVGGVRKDINKDKIEKVVKTLNEVEQEYQHLIETAMGVPQVKKRLSGTGILPRAEARALSVVGPVARGSGLARDVRKDYPYAAYHFVSFKVPVYSEGDNLARTLVRVEEVMESINIVKQLLDTLPQGPISVDRWDVEPFKRGIGAVEAPRGEVIHMVITGRYGPYRWRARAPTYQNLPAVPIMLRGVDLADAAITIASIDPCFSCTDRAIVLDLAKGSIRTIPISYITQKGLPR